MGMDMGGYMCLYVFFIMYVVVYACITAFEWRLWTYIDKRNDFVWIIAAGGGVLLVIILSGVLSRLLVQANDLDYLHPNYVWHCKVNFTNVGVTSALVCYFSCEKDISLLINNGWLLQAILWIMVAVQLWIGFDTFCKPRDCKKQREKLNWKET